MMDIPPMTILSPSLLIISKKVRRTVTPAKAGVQSRLAGLNYLDSRFHGNDENGLSVTIYESIIIA